MYQFRPLTCPSHHPVPLSRRCCHRVAPNGQAMAPTQQLKAAGFQMSDNFADQAAHPSCLRLLRLPSRTWDKTDCERPPGSPQTLLSHLHFDLSSQLHHLTTVFHFISSLNTQDGHPDGVYIPQELPGINVSARALPGLGSGAGEIRIVDKRAIGHVQLPHTGPPTSNTAGRANGWSRQACHHSCPIHSQDLGNQLKEAHPPHAKG